MRPDPKQQFQFILGIATSFAAHIVLAIFVIVVLQNAAATAAKAPEVFSVTIEGGMTLGGIGQVPKENAKKILTPEPAEPQTEDQGKEESKEETTKDEPEEAKLKAPSVVDDPEKILAERKKEEAKKEREKKVEEEKKEKAEKLKQDEKKKAEDKKKAEEDKKKSDEDKKKAEDLKKKEREKRDKQLAATLRKLKNQYEGESADAGGEGFGAAALGGKGMGGGTLASMEQIAYMNALKNHVKSGWRWLNSSDRLVCKVQVYMLADGRIQNVNMVTSSGNSNFDDSVIRAVLKASPVPVPPAGLYEMFKNATFTFDSAE